MKITKRVIETQEIEVCRDDVMRCSRDCPFCHKENGNYRCFLRSGGSIKYDDIEFGEKEDRDWGMNGLTSAESYGFTRTKYCVEKFGTATPPLTEKE